MYDITRLGSGDNKVDNLSKDFLEKYKFKQKENKDNTSVTAISSLSQPVAVENINSTNKDGEIVRSLENNCTSSKDDKQFLKKKRSSPERGGSEKRK
jgi:hypothetical protein